MAFFGKKKKRDTKGAIPLGQMIGPDAAAKLNAKNVPATTSGGTSSPRHVVASGPLSTKKKRAGQTQQQGVLGRKTRLGG